MKLYIFNLLLAIDELVNCLWGGAPADTLSGRIERAKLHGRLWGKLLYNFLDGIQKDHCEKALINDQTGSDRHTESVNLE